MWFILNIYAHLQKLSYAEGKQRSEVYHAACPKHIGDDLRNMYCANCLDDYQ